MIKGVEFKMGWEFLNDDETPKDLTGYEVLVQLKEFRSSEESIGEWGTLSSQITFDPVDGTVDLELPPTETNIENFTSGVIDCLVYTPTDGDRTPTVTITYCTGVSNP